MRPASSRRWGPDDYNVPLPLMVGEPIRSYLRRNTDLRIGCLLYTSDAADE